MDEPLTQQMVADLLLAKQRWDAGLTSTLEAGIEQLEVLLPLAPQRYRKRVQMLIDALQDYNDGDSTALDMLLRKE